MDNSRPRQPMHDPSSSALWRLNPINDEQYASNLTKIQKVKQDLEVFERSNKVAHQRYMELKLEERIREGRRAECVP